MKRRTKDETNHNDDRCPTRQRKDKYWDNSEETQLGTKLKTTMNRDSGTKSTNSHGMQQQELDWQIHVINSNAMQDENQNVKKLKQTEDKNGNEDTLIRWISFPNKRD